MASTQDSLVNKYTNLGAEIKKTIKNNEAIYKSIASGEYQDSTDFRGSLDKFEIKPPTRTDVDSTRGEIWDYLNKQYNEHTKMRKFYFEQIKNESQYLEELVKEKAELEGKLMDDDTKNNVIISHIKEEKYSISEMNYYFSMFKYLLMIELFALLIVGIGILGILPKLTVLSLCLLLGIICIGIVYYYLYYNNTDRNKFVWDKHDYPDMAETGSMQCTSVKPSSKDAKKAKIDKDLEKYIKA
jgi:hypothetical protein